MHSTQDARIGRGYAPSPITKLRSSRRLASIFVGLLLSSFLLGAIYLFDGVSHSATPPGNAPVVTVRDPLTWPFSRDSIWNLPIGSNANYVWANIAHATAMANFVDTDVIIMNPSAPLTNVYANYDDWGGGSRCVAQGGVIFTTPMPTDFVYLGNYMGNPDGTTPNAAAAFLAADGHTIIQTQPFARCPGLAPTSDYMFANEDLYGTGVTGSHGGSGLSALGGTVRLGELVPGGVIRHALKLNIDSVNFYGGFGGYRWPAWKSDAGGAGYGGSVPASRQGSLLALRPDFTIPTLETESGRIIAQAMKDYGAYIVDSAGWSVYGFLVERSPDGGVRDEFQARFGYSLNVAIGANGWARDLDKIFTNLYAVDNWDRATWQTVSASNGALGVGLGAPRVAWAPDFGQIPPPPPTLATTSTLTSTKNPSAINETITVSGRLLDTTSKPVAGRAVTLEWSGDAVTWAREGQIGQFPLTNSNGAFTGTMAFHGLNAHTEYLRANFPGDSSYGPSLSSVWAQSVIAPPSLDTIPPLTTYVVAGTAGNSNWYTSPVTVSLSASDVGSGLASVNIRVDGGAWVTYTTPVTVSGEGLHGVDYYAVDLAGNREATQSLSFRIDMIAPTASSVLAGTLGVNGWYVSPVTVSLAGADAGSGVGSVQVRRDSSPWFTYRSPIAIATNGPHTVEYYAVDVAGNSGTPTSASFKIDLIGPVTTAALVGTLGAAPDWYTSNVTVSMSASSSNGTTTSIAYRMDGGFWSSYAAPIRIHEGRHALAYQASDSSGAIEPLHSMTINVDTISPTIESPAGAITIPLGGIFSWSASDSGSGIASYALSVDGGAFQELGTKTTVNGAWSEGQHSATVKATDAAGNEATKTMTFLVDKNAPAQVGPVPTISEALLGLPVLMIIASLILGLAGVGLGVRRARRARDSEDDLDAQVDEYLDEIDDANVESI